MNDVSPHKLFSEYERRILRKASEKIDAAIRVFSEDYAPFKSDIYAKYQALSEEHTVLTYQVSSLRDEVEELRSLCRQPAKRG